MQNNLQIVSASISDRGLSEKRPENEDSFLEISNSGIYAVADGVGGAQAGDVASQMAMEIVGEAFVNMASPSDAEDVMKTAIERANSAIFEMSNELPQLSTMATTIVALHLSGNIATIGHVGDSRLYRVDSNGALYRETQDHSVVEEEVRAGRMTPEQAANHPSRNIISRALGAEPSVEVDLKTIMIEPNTTFLVCSDGITRHITDDEINALLFSSQQPADICRRMKEICYDRGAEDNLTAVIVRILQQSASAPLAEDFEQDTIATVRQPMAATAGASDSVNFESKETSRNVAAQNFDNLDLKTNNVEPIPTLQPEIVSSSNFETAPETYPTENKIEEKSPAVISYENEKTGTGVFGKLLGGLALLLLGMVIGAGGYYLFAKSKVEEKPPIVEQPVPESLPSNSFYSLIEGVDENPQTVISAYKNSADSPEDFYLLGRANLLLKNYAEAKLNFTEAKNRLAQADPGNEKILATEIAMGLALINGQFSLKEFEKELPVADPSNTNSSNTITPKPPSG